MKRWAVLIGLAAALHGGAATAAEDEGATVTARAIDQAVAVLQGRRDAAQTFDKRFLADVTPDRLRALAQQLVAQGGVLRGYDSVEPSGASSATFVLRFDHGSAPARIEINPAAPGLISGLRIFALLPTDDSFAGIDTAFAALPGKSGFAVYRLGGGDPQLVAGRAPTTPLAVASSFKLYVLAALVRQIRDGVRHWEDVVPVSAKSIPGGTVHTLPEGAPITVHTLASLMISISDNTATDMLMRLVGQDAIAREVRASGHADPQALSPMMTTAQMFARKRLGATAARAYSSASPARRAQMLAKLDTQSIARDDAVHVLGTGPALIDSVEWFASPADLAGVMDDLRRLDSAEADEILAINPAMDLVTRSRWSYVGYKGGSEDGVLAMTWLLRDAGGTWFAVSGCWNDASAALDTARFEVLMLRLAEQTRGATGAPGAIRP